MPGVDVPRTRNDVVGYENRLRASNATDTNVTACARIQYHPRPTCEARAASTWGNKKTREMRRMSTALLSYANESSSNINRRIIIININSNSNNSNITTNTNTNNHYLPLIKTAPPTTTTTPPPPLRHRSKHTRLARCRNPIRPCPLIHNLRETSTTPLLNKSARKPALPLSSEIHYLFFSVIIRGKSWTKCSSKPQLS